MKNFLTLALLGFSACVTALRVNNQTLTVKHQIQWPTEFGAWGAWRHPKNINTMHLDSMADYDRIMKPDNLLTCSKSIPQPPDHHENKAGKYMGGLETYYFQDANITDFFDSVDKIYVLCMNCGRVFPEALKDKVLHIDGKKSDACMGVHGHWAGPTAAHKLAITHAQQHGYKNAIVLEEDVVFVQGNQFDFEPIKNLIHDSSKPWEIMRLNWMDGSRTGAKCGGCALKKWITKSMGTMDRPNKESLCKLTSSAGYMLSANSFSRFLGLRGGIDGEIINAFDQTLLIPELCHQIEYLKTEQDDQIFYLRNKDNCHA